MGRWNQDLGSDLGRCRILRKSKILGNASISMTYAHGRKKVMCVCVCLVQHQFFSKKILK